MSKVSRKRSSKKDKKAAPIVDQDLGEPSAPIVSATKSTVDIKTAYEIVRDSVLKMIWENQLQTEILYEVLPDKETDKRFMKALTHYITGNKRKTEIHLNDPNAINILISHIATKKREDTAFPIEKAVSAWLKQFEEAYKNITDLTNEHWVGCDLSFFGFELKQIVYHLTCRYMLCPDKTDDDSWYTAIAVDVSKLQRIITYYSLNTEARMKEMKELHPGLIEKIKVVDRENFFKEIYERRRAQQEEEDILRTTANSAVVGDDLQVETSSTQIGSPSVVHQQSPVQQQSASPYHSMPMLHSTPALNSSLQQHVMVAEVVNTDPQPSQQSPHVRFREQDELDILRTAANNAVTGAVTGEDLLNMLEQQPSASNQEVYTGVTLQTTPTYQMPMYNQNVASTTSSMADRLDQMEKQIEALRAQNTKLLTQKAEQKNTLKDLLTCFKSGFTTITNNQNNIYGHVIEEMNGLMSKLTNHAKDVISCVGNVQKKSTSNVDGVFKKPFDPQPSTSAASSGLTNDFPSPIPIPLEVRQYIPLRNYEFNMNKKCTEFIKYIKTRSKDENEQDLLFWLMMSINSLNSWKKAHSTVTKNAQSDLKRFEFLKDVKDTLFCKKCKRELVDVITFRENGTDAAEVCHACATHLGTRKQRQFKFNGTKQAAKILNEHRSISSIEPIRPPPTPAHTVSYEDDEDDMTPPATKSKKNKSGYDGLLSGIVTPKTTSQFDDDLPPLKVPKTIYGEKKKKSKSEKMIVNIDGMTKKRKETEWDITPEVPTKTPRFAKPVEMPRHFLKPPTTEAPKPTAAETPRTIETPRKGPKTKTTVRKHPVDDVNKYTFRCINCDEMVRKSQQQEHILKCKNQNFLFEKIQNDNDSDHENESNKSNNEVTEISDDEFEDDNGDNEVIKQVRGFFDNDTTQDIGDESGDSDSDSESDSDTE